MSKQGTSMSRWAATLQLSAGESQSGAELPLITMPRELASIPARSSATRAAPAESSGSVMTLASGAARRSRLRVSRM